MNSQWQIPAFAKTEFHPRRSKYAVLIPVLNEGPRIRSQLARMKPWMERFDVIIIDGGSTDDSFVDIDSSGIRALLVKTGPGKLSAQLRLGLAYALDEGYDGCILIDGNNKDNPAAIDLFAERLDQGFDHVQGSRFIQGGKMSNNPASRVWAIRLIHAPLISLSAGFRYTDTTNGFRAYSRKFLLDSRVQPFRDIFSAYELHYYLAIQAPRYGFRTVEIPVERSYPKNEPTPTKIKGFKGNLLIMRTLLKACGRQFDPTRS